MLGRHLPPLNSFPRHQRQQTLAAMRPESPAPSFPPHPTSILSLTSSSFTLSSAHRTSTPSHPSIQTLTSSLPSSKSNSASRDPFPVVRSISPLNPDPSPSSLQIHRSLDPVSALRSPNTALTLRHDTGDGRCYNYVLHTMCNIQHEGAMLQLCATHTFGM